MKFALNQLFLSERNRIVVDSLFREQFRKLVLRFARENKVPVNDVYYELYGAFLIERKTPWMIKELRYENSKLEYFDKIGLLPELLDFAEDFLRDISSKMSVN